jgi:DNA-binding transcriptional MocR family regulator
VDKEVAHRFAELVGLGLTQHEAAGAVGIGTRTGERLLTKPEIRQVVEQTRTAGGGDPTILALLEATDEAGNPDWEQQMKGAELALADLAGESGDSRGRAIHRDAAASAALRSRTEGFRELRASLREHTRSPAA